ncbi:MAG: hypothetical protein EOM52_06145 [Clostridia bacterium]|nr:hypothetical protein [Clostridia bacterium]
MKRLFASALCAAALVSLTACGGPKAGPTPTQAPVPIITAAPDAIPLPTPRSTPQPLPSPTPSAFPVPAPLTTAAAFAPGDGWLACTSSAEVGETKPAALSEARVDDDGLSLCFVPMPTEEDIQAFRQSSTEPPKITVSYHADYGVLFVKLQNTVLSSGEPESGEEDWVYDYVRDQGLAYPYSVAAGSLGKDTRFFTKPAISSDGTDTTITLILTDAAQEYRVETDHLTDEMFPTVRIVFREQK